MKASTKKMLIKTCDYGYFLLSLVVSILCWKLTSDLKAAQLQPIASAISTFAGILFGFVMASITLLASAKNNTLVINTQKTGYLGKLVDRLHKTMGLLLIVCVVFIILLFLPDTLTFSMPFIENKKNYLYSGIILQLGIFVLLLAFKNFFITWLRFKEFTKLM